MHSYSFADFLLERFGDETEQDIEKRRSDAYHSVYKKIKAAEVASAVTIKSWFGIKPYRKPSRQKLYHLAFALRLSAEETMEYFTKGLHEPGVQINDYRELIYYFGLEHQLSYEECQGMILTFERYLQQDMVIEQKTYTAELWQFYRQWRQFSKENFLLAMCQNAGKFKGYSKTALNYFISYKDEILVYVREEAKEQLLDLLNDTNFFVWLREQELDKISYEEEILRFLKNETRHKHSEISRERLLEIKYYYWIAYAKENRSTDLIVELYAGALDQEEYLWGKNKKIIFRNREEFDLPESVRFMSNSYVSKLLHVSEQKEREIRLSSLRSKLLLYEKKEACPEWAVEEFKKYGKMGDDVVPRNCDTLIKSIDKLLQQQRKRCVLVERDDLLPLIHCLAQKKYTEKQRSKTLEYDKNMAKQNFIDLANATLTACQMPTIDEKYEMDHFLLSAFQDSENLSFSELIEDAAL